MTLPIGKLKYKYCNALQQNLWNTIPGAGTNNSLKENLIKKRLQAIINTCKLFCKSYYFITVTFSQNIFHLFYQSFPEKKSD